MNGSTELAAAEVVHGGEATWAEELAGTDAAEHAVSGAGGAPYNVGAAETDDGGSG